MRALLGVAAVVLVLLAGCGATKEIIHESVVTTTVTTTETVAVDPTPSPLESCAIGRYGHNVTVTIVGPEALATCEEFVRVWSVSSSNFWQAIGATGGRKLICQLTLGGYVLTVQDDGYSATTLGNEVCANLVYDAWAEIIP